MMKRLLCFFLAICLCTVPFVVPQASADNAIPQDISFLQDLDILEDIPDKGLYERRLYYTREKLAKTLSMMLLTGEPVIIQEPEIRDVAGNEYINYIDFAVTQNLMKLDQKLMFYPKDYVTLDMVVFGLVSALEYHPLAEEKGGTAEAYLSVAGDIGILRNVDIKDPDRVTILELGKMVNNAMRITPMVQKDEIITCVKPTLLEQKELIRKSGRILANSNVGLSIGKCPKGYVNIDGKLYPTNLMIEDITVGSIVTYYTQKIDNKEMVVSYYATSDEGLLSLDADQIDEVAFSGRTLEIAYGDGEIAKVASTAFVLVNGKNYALNQELFDVFKSGSMNMRDSDEDGVYDVVYMDLYKTEVVSAVGSAANTIITKYYNQTIKLDSVKDNLQIINENRLLELDQIEIGQAISIACDDFSIENGQLIFNYNTAEKIKICVSNKQAVGVVTQITGNDTVSIDGLEFDIEPYLQTLITNGKAPKFIPGQAVILTLDIYDKVVDYQINNAENLMEYGYLIDAAVNSQGLNRNLMLKVLCVDGEIKIFDAAKTYLLNGSLVKEHSLTGTNGENLDTRQLIRYRVQDNLVKEIDTVQVNPLAESTQNSLSRDIDLTDSAVTYRFGSFGRKLVMMSTTPAFSVPDPATVSVDDSQFVRLSTSTVKQDGEYIVEGYDVDDRLIAGCIVTYAASAATNFAGADPVYMISDICRAVAPNGTVTTQVTLLGSKTGSTEVLYFSDDVDCRRNHNMEFGNESPSKTGNELTASDFKKGDLVRYLKDSGGYIKVVERVFRYSSSEQPRELLASGITGAYGRSYSAYEYSVNLDYMTVCMNRDIANATPDQYYAIPTSRFEAVPVYNVNEDEVYMVTNLMETPAYTSASDTMLYLATNTIEVNGAFGFQLD